MPTGVLGHVIAAITGADKVTLTLSERSGEVKTDTDTLRFRCLSSQFPDYRQVIPSAFKRWFRVDRDDFLGVLAQVAPMLSMKTATLMVSPDGLSISSRETIDRKSRRLNSSHSQISY